jgi:riboflavin kinase/FMN adenylyltransferase
MEIVKGIKDLGGRALRGTVLTIGNFDGVHLGHCEILRTVCEKAKARAVPGIAAAYTFKPHPQVALRPGANVQLLSTYDEKLKLLERAGMDLVIEEPFSREFSTVSPELFFSDVVLRLLSAEAIVVGYDFAFGKERQGHLPALQEFCQKTGVELTIVPPHRMAGEVVSSSRIRQHLLSGEIEAAARLLGRPFSYHGVVSRGEGRGRKIGFPTANLSPENKLVLPYGVYATWTLWDGKKTPSITNIGVRPTFGDKELPVLIETHLMDMTEDLYGCQLEVSFVRRLREERRFSGIDQLKEQIVKDVAQARAILAAV